MLYLFWLPVGFVLYTLVGYPTLLWLVSLFRTRPDRRGAMLPTVSIIIVAHNEGAALAEKIRETLAFDYPQDKLEVVVGSDASTDETFQIVRSFAAQGLKLVESPQRLGKHHLQMLVRDVSRGEILVFTDATIRIEPGVLRKIVAHFADPSVGAVCSVDQLADGKKNWRGEHFYVYGEMGLRRLEAQVSSLVSLSGALFGLRREICDAWHPDMSSDFFLALHTVERGYRSVLDPECRARLRIIKSQKAELSRKVRTIVHGLVVFFSHLHLLNPFRFGIFAWQLMSHKLFRWLLPFALILVLVSNAFLWRVGGIYRVTLILQLIGYAAGLISSLLGDRASLGVLRLANFFVLGNAATLIAWWRFCQGDKMVVWEPSRRG